MTRLAGKWDAWAARANVLPLGGWRLGRNVNNNGGGGGRAAGNGSKAASFTLKKDDHLDRNEVPAIAKKGFTITAEFEPTGDDGVIVAQGGAARGYSLSIHEGKLTFFIHEGDRTAKAVLPTALAAGEKKTAVARLATDGALSLSIEGGEEASDKGIGLINTLPLDGLDVGKDSAAPVGPYTTAAAFKGAIPRVKIDVNLK